MVSQGLFNKYAWWDEKMAMFRLFLLFECNVLILSVLPFPIGNADVRADFSLFDASING